MSIEFLKFLREWNNGKEEFKITTSGSTGDPKEFLLKRELLCYSAEQTFKELEFTKLTKIYNCIPVNKIGGFMNWVRAVHYKLDIQTVAPTANPMVHLSNSHNFTFVSLVPYQLYAILEDSVSREKLNRFKTILLGGSPINPSYMKDIIELDSQVFLSYGMTETYSHIALKRISKEDIGYRPIGDMQIQTSEDKTAILKGTITQGIPLNTNDVISILDDGSFEIVGRLDFVINTGGIKVSPELLENKLLLANPGLKGRFLFTSKKEERLGEKVILVMECAHADLYFNGFEKEEIPKEIIWNYKFPLGENLKVKRREVFTLLNS